MTGAELLFVGASGVILASLWAGMAMALRVTGF